MALEKLHFKIFGVQSALVQQKENQVEKYVGDQIIRFQISFKPMA